MSSSVSGPAHADSGQPSSASDAQPREVMNVAVLAESELGSEAQRERRKRILDATMAIASKGGYEAVQMRAVADRADVAVGTLYRYFPSKVHLLVSALGREFERIDAKTDRSALTGGTEVRNSRSACVSFRASTQEKELSVKCRLPFRGQPTPTRANPRARLRRSLVRC